MGKARHNLGLAEKFLELAPEQAARLGYMAAFHACRATVLAATGKEPKTHSGVRSAFGELVIKEQALGRELGRYISAAMKARTSRTIRSSMRSISPAQSGSLPARGSLCSGCLSFPG
jgi:uncharacterized protein (UPF0332 family)